MEKVRVTLLIARSTWRMFRAACMARGLAAGHVLERAMTDQMERWAEEAMRADKR